MATPKSFLYCRTSKFFEVDPNAKCSSSCGSSFRIILSACIPLFYILGAFISGSSIVFYVLGAIFIVVLIIDNRKSFAIMFKCDKKVHPASAVAEVGAYGYVCDAECGDMPYTVNDMPHICPQYPVYCVQPDSMPLMPG